MTVPSLVPAARSAAAATGARQVVVLGEAEGATPILDLLAAGAPTPTPTRPALDPATAVALLPYSSGTTGLPKGVELTHANLVTSVRQVAAGLRVAERDTCSPCRRSPTSWGSWSPWPCRCRRARPWSPCPASTPGGSWSCSSATGSPCWSAPRRCCGSLTGHPAAAGTDLGSLELVVCGGAALSAAAQEALAERLPGATVGQA